MASECIELDSLGACANPTIDRACLPTREQLEYMTGMTGMHEFAEFAAADIGTVVSGLNSIVLASDTNMVSRCRRCGFCCFQETADFVFGKIKIDEFGYIPWWCRDNTGGVTVVLSIWGEMSANLTGT